MRADLLGVPKSVLRGERELQQMREAKAAQAQMEQQMQMAQQQANIAQSQGSALKDMSDPQTKDIIDEATEIAREEGLL